MPVTVHLGAHKTATTHLQEALSLARPALSACGVYYVGPGELRGELLPLTPGINDSGRLPQRQRARRRLVTAGDVYPEILISDENIVGGTKRHRIFGKAGRIYPDAGLRLGRLMSILRNQPVTAALSVRDPAQFNLSAFSLQVSLGYELDLDNYMSGRDPAALSWTDLARRILAIQGINRLIVWRYEDYRALREPVLRALLPAQAADCVPDPRPANVSLSQQGFDWLVGRAMADTEIDLRILARRARRRFPRSEGHDALDMFSAADKARSAENYSRDIAALRALPGVEFLSP